MRQKCRNKLKNALKSRAFFDIFVKNRHTKVCGGDQIDRTSHQNADNIFISHIHHTPARQKADRSASGIRICEHAPDIRNRGCSDNRQEQKPVDCHNSDNTDRRSRIYDPDTSFQISKTQADGRGDTELSYQARQDRSRRDEKEQNIARRIFIDTACKRNLRPLRGRIRRP